jgi:hypothetical protein
MPLAIKETTPVRTGYYRTAPKKLSVTRTEFTPWHSGQANVPTKAKTTSKGPRRGRPSASRKRALKANAAKKTTVRTSTITLPLNWR